MPPFRTYSLSSYQRGFSLVELAAVMAILALISGTLLSVASSRVEQQNLAQMKTRFDDIEEALQRHVNLFGFLPCPAIRTAAENTPDFGKATDCSAGAPAGTIDTGAGNEVVRIGVVPTRALGLPDRYMYDEWGNRITYAVITALTTDAEAYLAYVTTTTDGVIRINDRAGNRIPQPIDPDGDGNYQPVVVYALISHGKDKKGAYNRRGLLVEACGTASEKDAANCDDDNSNVFVDSDINDSDTAANYYYDKVRWTLWQDTVATRGEEEEESVAGGASMLTSEHACAIKADATAWCWGKNWNGQLGDNSTTNRFSPVQVQNLTSAAQLTYQLHSTCALKTDGTVYCWGRNAESQIGDGTTTERHIATAASITGASTVDGGQWMNLSVKTDGTIWIWGHLYGDPAAFSTWNSIEQADITRYNNSEHAICYVKTDATVWCGGENDHGQLGDGTTTNQLLPNKVQVSGLTSIIQIAVSEDGNACALKTDGTVWCWGQGNAGQLGNGGTSDQDTPVQATGLTDVTAISAGGGNAANAIQGYFCAVKNNNTLWCWGSNTSSRRLGDGNTGDRSTPTQALLADVESIIATGDYFACAKKTDDTIWCWGDDFYGSLGDGAGDSSSFTPVQVQNFP